MSDKVKVGILGCGAVSRLRHIPGFTKVKNKAVIQAACDKDENVAREVAKKFGIPRVYSDITEMLDRENLDVVDICVPQQLHAPIAIQSLEYGCHVLIEKPMALSISECDRMIQAAHENGVKLCIIHNVLFHAPFLRAKELIANGKIGDFIGMRILISDPTDEMIMRKDYWVHKLPGGLIGETAPHVVYMSLAFLNNISNVEIYAKNFLEHPWAPFDEFRLELEGENGLSSIIISYTSNRRNCCVDILGTEGALQLDLNSMLITHQGKKDSLKPVDLARYSLGLAFQITAGVAANAFRVVTRKAKIGHDVVIEKFVDSILNDEPPPVTGEEGREVVRVLDIIVRRLREKYGR